MIFKKVDGAKEPVRSTQHSAGLDLFTLTETILHPGKVTSVVTGISYEMSEVEKEMGLYLSMSIRSSMGAKGFMIANSPAILDGDFEDQIRILIYNTNTLATCLPKGEKIAQMIVLQHHNEFVDGGATFRYDKRTGGLGSTS